MLSDEPMVTETTFQRKLREKREREAVQAQARADAKAAEQAERDALLAPHRHADGTPFGLEDWKPNQHGLTQEERDKRYFAAAVAGMIVEMQECKSMRNNLLNALAYRLGRLSAGLNLPADEMALELGKAALRSGLGKHEIVKTIRSGLASGLKNPWTSDER